MEEAPRKRGRPKLFLTKEMVEERRLLKRICRNSRRNLQDKDENVRVYDVTGAELTVQTGEASTREGTDATLDEIGGLGPFLESSDAVVEDPPGIFSIPKLLRVDPNNYLQKAQTFEQPLATLGALSYGLHTEKIQIRILREWNTCSLNNYYEVMKNYVILDSENKPYWAVTDITTHGHIRPPLCVGLLYCISNFKIAHTSPSNRPIDADIAILIGKNTKVQDVIQSSSIPRHNFNICAVRNILSTFSKEVALTDAAGVIKKVGNINYGRNDIEQLCITLVIGSLSEIEITLWGMKATFFGIDFRYHRDRNVVIVATGLRTKKVGDGKLCLSSTQATTITFNPRFEKLTELGQHIANEYGEFICPVPEETHLGEYVIPTEVPEYSTLHNLLATTVWAHDKGNNPGCLCNPREPTTCFTCNQQVMIHGSTYYYIHYARKYVTPIKSTGIPLLVADETGTTTMTIRGTELKQLTGFHLNHFMQYSKDIGTTPGCLLRIKGSRCTFEVELIPTTESNAAGDILITKLNQYTNLRACQH